MKAHRQAAVFTLLAAGRSQREIKRVTGIDRKTIRAYQRHFEAEQAESPGVTTDPIAQIPPPRPPATGASTIFACERYRAFIEAQLRLQ